MTDPRDSRAPFPSTHWSRFAGSGPSQTRGRGDFEHLAQAYWPAVYAFIRRTWRSDRDTALDRTQEFFLWMFESDFVHRADPARGRFRALVKTALHNWLIDRDRADRARRRGGGGSNLLTIDPANAADLPADASQLSPDAVLDQRWRQELLAHALRDVEGEFADADQGDWWEAFHSYFVEPEPGIDYRTLANRHGLTLTQVSNRLRKAKDRFRARLRALVAETVADPDELEAELEWLFDA